MYSLRIENLHKSYQKNKDNREKVLEDINLSVKKGEFITLLGPSGCGKSTLLHILAGLEKPQRGNIFCKDQPITGPDQDRVMIMQDAALFPWLTVLKNVCFGLRERGFANNKAIKLARQELSRVGLSEVESSYPHQLSGGMQQRVALARGLVLKPEIILMDEPFAALDEQTRLKLQRELIDLWQERNMTIIFVTHSIREALLLSRKVLVMASNPGKIKSKYELKLSYPRHPGNNKIIELEEKILTELEPSLTPKETTVKSRTAGGEHK